VCDGFAGNVILKFYESVARFLIGVLKEELEAKEAHDLDLSDLFRFLDYEEYGGAPLLGVNGISIIDDAYNANPHSVKAALDTLQQVAPQRTRIVVLGDMLELGKTAAALHSDVGRHAALTAPERLYLTGDFSSDTAQGARDGGIATDQIFIGSVQEITADLITRASERDTILVKGSRGMRMERIVKELIDTFGQNQRPPSKS
jgi:UDP-N-acetylmuramoyl-tripeptide--D-alanyl-D-alanine ligase